MRKNTLKKAMAVMMSAAMLITGYTAASAEGRDGRFYRR